MAQEVFRKAYSLIVPEEEPKTWLQEFEEQLCSICPQMSWQHRVIGCFTCMVVGFLLSLGSTFRLIKLLEGDPEPFAVMYSIGNIIGILSTCFLYGPWTQAKKMFAPTRLAATGAYLFFLGMTMFLALYPKEIPLRLFLLIISILCQFLALIWYSISYIPFARDIVLSCCKQTCCHGACNGSCSDDDWA